MPLCTESPGHNCSQSAVCVRALPGRLLASKAAGIALIRAAPSSFGPCVRTVSGFIGLSGVEKVRTVKQVRALDVVLVTLLDTSIDPEGQLVTPSPG